MSSMLNVSPVKVAAATAAVVLAEIVTTVAVSPITMAPDGIPVPETFMPMLMPAVDATVSVLVPDVFVVAKFAIVARKE